MTPGLFTGRKSIRHFTFAEAEILIIHFQDRDVRRRVDAFYRCFEVFAFPILYIYRISAFYHVVVGHQVAIIGQRKARTREPHRRRGRCSLLAVDVADKLILRVLVLFQVAFQQAVLRGDLLIVVLDK